MGWRLHTAVWMHRPNERSIQMYRKVSRLFFMGSFCKKIHMFAFLESTTFQHYSRKVSRVCAFVCASNDRVHIVLGLSLKFNTVYNLRCVQGGVFIFWLFFGSSTVTWHQYWQACDLDLDSDLSDPGVGYGVSHVLFSWTKGVLRCIFARKGMVNHNNINHNSNSLTNTRDSYFFSFSGSYF